MSRTIPEETIEKIRQEFNIVEIIGEYVQLKRQGRNYFGLCPFHDESTPSFSVTEEKQIFHCFGCGKGGNVYTFLMEIETFTFLDAVRYLAERANIELPQIQNKQSSLSEEANRILEANEWLSKYYHHLLKYTDEGEEALAYFKERSITEKTIDQFQLGFSPENSDVTVQFLLKKDFHPQTLTKAGILSERSGNQIDPFRGRITFPIRNHLGRTVAFGGRIIQGEGPKYLNSPENELFHKGQLLFNFDLAKNHIRKQNEVILFEGYMDVISAYQAGIKNVVATLGTSLSQSQANLIRRYVDHVVICYDTDDAGLNGAYQAANLLKQTGCDVKIAYMPENLDPDSYIIEYGGDIFKQEIIHASYTYFKFFMLYKKREYNLSIDSERFAFIDVLIEQLSMIETAVEREYYANEIAQEFNLSVDTILNDIKKQNKLNNNDRIKDNSRKNSNTNSNFLYGASQKKTLLPAYEQAERILLAHLLQNDELIEEVQENLGISFNLEVHRIILIHLYAHYEEYGTINVSELINKLDDNQLQQVVTELVMLPISDSLSREELLDYIHIIKTEATVYNKLRELKMEQKQLEQKNDPIAAAKIGLEIIQLKKSIKR